MKDPREDRSEENLMKRVLTIIALLFAAPMLAACSSTPKDYAIMPDPILCKAAVETNRTYFYYPALLKELNKRDLDCAEFVRQSLRNKRNVEVQVNR